MRADLKRLSLELGGNAPLIVFDDADLDAAVAGAIASKFRNTGQTCVCANRLLVRDGVYELFAEKLGQAVAQLKVGDGAQAEVSQGPLIDEAALSKVEELVADALAQGGRCVTGGQRHALGGTFYEPTILADVTPAMKLASEEIFGPVAPLFRFKTEPRRSRWPTTPRTGWRRTSSLATWPASGAWPARSTSAWWASTPESSARPSRHSAASSNRASDAKVGAMASRATSTPRTFAWAAFEPCLKRSTSPTLAPRRAP